MDNTNEQAISELLDALRCMLDGLGISRTGHIVIANQEALDSACAKARDLLPEWADE